MISTNGARHSTSLEVSSRIAMGATVRDGDAAAIASWFQTPRGHGLTFALLAQGSDVARADVLAAIVAESAIPGVDAAVGAELDALATWTRSQPSV